ncbi:MAG: RICIN domain-containing protein [Chloroflexi bacterium]|nr:RICIN domain-containing protein [Chloroflexota bacterium]
MNYRLFGLALILVIGVLACDLTSIMQTTAPTATPDRIATGVAEAQAIAATLTAQAPKPASSSSASAVSSAVSSVTFSSLAPLPSSSSSTASSVSSFASSATVASPAPPPPATFYNLIMRYSKNCLGVQGNQAAEVTCNSSSQVWNITTINNGYLQLQFQNSGNCLSASSNHETDPLVITTCNGSDAQSWQKKSSGGYFQLVSKIILAEDPTNMCPDARQWSQPIMQWPCKPWGTDDQLDNQLFCQTTSNVANCAAPAGIYVTSIQQTPPPYTDEGKPNTFHFFFNVTFSNTTGQTQSFPWFVRTFGQNGGQTSQKVIPIPPGTSTISVGPWDIGRTCGDYTAKVIWIRTSDGLSFTLKKADGSEYALSFRIQTGC